MKKLLILPIIFLLFISISYAAYSKLEITDLTLIHNVDEQRNIKNGYTYNEAIEPGDTIKFEIELKNTFKENTDIEDIEINVLIPNITEGNSIGKNVSKFDINNDKSITKSIKLDIPKEADEIIKPVYINIKGIDENNTVHIINWVVYLRIEDEDHNVGVYNTRINKTTLDCNEKVDMTVWLENDGSFDEDNVRLELENKDLGFYDVYRDISIDEDEKYTKLITITNNFNKTGDFPITLKVYYKDTHLDDVETINMHFNACKTGVSDVEESETEEETEEPVVIEPEVNLSTDGENDSNAIEQAQAQLENNKQNKTIVIMVFGLIFILLMVVLILVVLFVVRKK